MIEAGEGFRKETIERQLGALAATLARVASTARRPSRSGAIVPLLGECIAFIEWTAPRVEPEVGGELAHLQVLLALWREAWNAIEPSASGRAILSLTAKEWSDRVLDHSGLLGER